MNIAQVAHWMLAGLAAGLYVGVNVYFVRTIVPQPSAETCGPLARSLGHWLPQAAVLASLVLLLQMLVAPLLLSSMVLYCLLLANNTKVTLLREPLLPSDIIATLRHPHTWRLLAPYVRFDRWTITIAILVLAAIMAGCAWEPWLLGRYRLSLAALGPVLMAVVFVPLLGDSLMVRTLTAVKSPFWGWAPLQTMAAAGFFPTFLRFIGDVPRPAVRQMGPAEAQAVLAKALAPNLAAYVAPSRKPHLVVVLSEAFFDPRSAGLVVEPDPLPSLDDAARRSAYSGLCWVPVYGGWTTRSEYSLLTGISMSSLASIVGNPYSTLLSDETYSLPKYLGTQGYRNVMIHPYDCKFYGRDKACLALGFDAFLDQHSFPGAPYEGRYISDVAVAMKIEEELRAAKVPTLLFCITMENHGPWEGETLPPMAPFTTRPQLSPNSHSSFAHYLRHLRNADLMIRRLVDFVLASGDPTVLLFLGDHLPAMPEVLAELGYPPIDIFRQHLTPDELSLYRTPYFLLSNAATEPRAMDCDISLLSGLLLDCAGLNGDQFFRRNSAMRNLAGGNLHNEAVDENVRLAYLRYSYEVAVFPKRYVSMPWQ